MNCIINSIFVGLVLTISLEFDEAQSESVTVHDSCSTKMSCRACIQTQNCAWCLQTSYENRTRCFQPGLRITDDCTLKWYPRNEENITEESPLTQKQSSSSVPLSKNIVQISPQRVSLKLRISRLHHQHKL